MNTNKSKKRTYFLVFIFLFLIVFFSSCKDESTLEPTDPNDVLNSNAQIKMQVAFDASNVAFRFKWRSQLKTMPAGYGNTGKIYPGQFHDMLKHNGTKFDRLPSGARMDEDRITFMIENISQPVQGFAASGCFVSCHSGMASHNIDNAGFLDHWHWRGGRSGPMNYAEDAAVSEVERVRDLTATPPTKFTRSGGDRLREDQAALAGTGHPVLENGFPRFLFNKGKTMSGGYVIPAYFLTNEAGVVMTDPYAQIPEIKNLDINRSLIVVYQDLNFDPINKVNSIDLGYLVYVALGITSHLPAHLQDVNSPDFTFWANYWSDELNISTSATAQAITKLNEIYQEWVNSGNNAMTTRSVGFIYASDQHDITTTRSFDAVKGEWTVTLYRKLSTGSVRDGDLSALQSGQKYTLSVAVHDVGGGAISHDFCFPVQFGTAEDVHLKAASVSNVQNAQWNTLPSYQTRFIRQSSVPKTYKDWLTSGAHPGAGLFNDLPCLSCHKEEILNAP